MNLDYYEWSNVIHKSDDINVALYGAQAAKGIKSNGPENELQVWMHQRSMNGKKINGKQLEFYSEADARKDAELHKPLAKTKDKVELEVNSEYRQRPAETMQMRMVLFEIMKRLIDKHKYHNCEGCNLSPPVSGQKALMKMGGCLDEGMNFAEQYIQQSWAIVEPGDLVAVYNPVC